MSRSSSTWLALIADEIIRKIDSVVGLGNVRWLCARNRTPMSPGAGRPGGSGLHPEAAIVTHWRDEALIIHSGTSLKFWRVDEHGWRLELQDRTLRFVLTPYSHSAARSAPLTKSPRRCSRRLSSGASPGFFVVCNISRLLRIDAVVSRAYMPSREILAYAIDQLRELPMREIAPHHGQVIRRI